MRIQRTAITMIGLLLLGVSSGCTDSEPDASEGSIRSNALATPNTGILSGVSQVNALNNRKVTGLHDNTFFQLNDEMTDVVIHMPGVQSAYVMTTDRNAYVAVNRGTADVLTNGPQLPDVFRLNVSNAIRSRSPSTRNVFVSEDPLLWSRMQTYTQAVREGYPLQRFVAEFNSLVQQVFPAETNQPQPFR